MSLVFKKILAGLVERKGDGSIYFDEPGAKGLKGLSPQPDPPGRR